MNSRKKALQWIVVNTCRLLVSATFVFSGFVKLIDPHGTEYKLQDYAAALHLSTILSDPIPLFLAIALAMTEFCTGVYLLFGMRRRFAASLATALLLIFTPLTLWLAITDAVPDCGCFGDAIHLTNWQTFAKNAILLPMAILLCRTRDLQTRLISEAAQWMLSLYTILFAIALALLCLWMEPIIDFRPFHEGQDIAAAMQWPEDPERQPEILDFTIEPLAELDSLGTTPDIDEILADTGYTFLLIAPYLERADDSHMEEINAIADYALTNNHRFLCLTTSGTKTIQRWQELTGAEYPFAFTDELTLKTICRSNPGYILLHGSVITAKGSGETLPTFIEQFQQNPATFADVQQPDIRRRITAILLAYIIPLAALSFIDRLILAIRWWWRRRKTANRQQPERPEAL